MRIIVQAVFILVFVLCTSCDNQRSIKAKIFERKKVDNKNLNIKYRYTVGEKQFTDSATLDDTVILGDSVSIMIDPSSPHTSTFNPNK